MLCYAANGLIIAITETVIRQYELVGGESNYITDGRGTLLGYSMGYNTFVPGSLLDLFQVVQSKMIRTLTNSEGKEIEIKQANIPGLDDSFPKLLVCSNESLEETVRRLSEILVPFTNEESGEISFAFFSEFLNFSYGSRESSLEGVFKVDRSNESGLPVLTVNSDWFELSVDGQTNASEGGVIFPETVNLSFENQPINMQITSSPQKAEVKLDEIVVKSNLNFEEEQFGAILEFVQNLALDTNVVKLQIEKVNQKLEELTFATSGNGAENAAVASKVSDLSKAVNNLAVQANLVNQSSAHLTESVLQETHFIKEGIFPLISDSSRSLREMSNDVVSAVSINNKVDMWKYMDKVKTKAVVKGKLEKITSSPLIKGTALGLGALCILKFGRWLISD